jgi:hypothetical protein
MINCNNARSMVNFVKIVVTFLDVSEKAFCIVRVRRVIGFSRGDVVRENAISRGGGVLLIEDINPRSRGMLSL